MKKAIIIDDEPLARSIIIDYLKNYKDIQVVEECSNGFEGIKALNTHQPDLIFLDIQMPKITGFEMLELIENPPCVIFTTAFDEYAIKAFETNATDYLLKPFNLERFDKAIQKFNNSNTASNTSQTKNLIDNAAKLPVQNERVVVKTGNKIKVISVYDIEYLEADDDYVNIHTFEGNFLKNRTLSFFEKTLDDTLFIRIHRSFIVKLDQITKIEPYEKDSHIVILKSGKRIPVSKSGYPKLTAVLGI